MFSSPVICEVKLKYGSVTDLCDKGHYVQFIEDDIFISRRAPCWINADILLHC